jgi:anti-sigma factor RsiW
MVARPVDDRDLHAYVDGCLDPQRRIEVEACLAEDPASAERVNAYRSQIDQLHELFDDVLGEQSTPAMDDLQNRLAGKMAGNDNYRRGWLRSPFARMAAAVVLLLAGGTGGWMLRDPEPTVVEQQQPPLQSFAQEAVQAHTFYASDNRFAVEMGGEDRGALDSWLSERLGRRIFGPDLSSAGFRLIGGRSLPTATGVGAQYMYENDGKRRLTLFVGTPKAGQEAAFSFVQKGDVSMFYWVEGSIAYALIGRLDRDQLMNITQTVYRELKIRNVPPAPPPAAPPPPEAAKQAPAAQPVGDIKRKDM